MRLVLTGALFAALFLCVFAYYLDAEGQSFAYGFAALLVSSMLGVVRR